EIDRLIEYEIENTKLKTKLHESERTANQKTEIEKEYDKSTIKNYKDEIYRLEKEILRINMELNENLKDMIIEMQNKIENLNKFENEKNFDEERTLKTDKNFELAFKNEEIFKLEEKINSLYTDIENSDILRKEKEATFNQLKNDYDDYVEEIVFKANCSLQNLIRQHQLVTPSIVTAILEQTFYSNPSFNIPIDVIMFLEQLQNDIDLKNHDNFNFNTNFNLPFLINYGVLDFSSN
ncbi:hypothetical protein BpHYR1_049997, partial [Brachionus plicatilis]